MQVALLSPQIPQNFGSVARTCAATSTPLHLIGEPAFPLDKKSARRAGLDYWPYVTLQCHPSMQQLLSESPALSWWLISSAGEIPYYHVEFGLDDVLVFANEIHSPHEASLVPPSRHLTIPLVSNAAGALNLSNQVAIVLFEALRQHGFNE